MIDFIRPPLGPRVDLLRIQAVQRTNQTREEEYLAVISRENRQIGESSSTRAQFDQATFSNEALQLLAKDLANEQQLNPPR